MSRGVARLGVVMDDDTNEEREEEANATHHQCHWCLRLFDHLNVQISSYYPPLGLSKPVSQTAPGFVGLAWEPRETWSTRFSNSAFSVSLRLPSSLSNPRPSSRHENHLFTLSLSWRIAKCRGRKSEASTRLPRGLFFPDSRF